MLTGLAGGIDEFTVLMLHFDLAAGQADGSTIFADSSIYNHTITASGNAQLDTAQSVFGGCSYLGDGTGDFLTATFSNMFKFGTRDFTVDFRVRFSSVLTGTQAFLDLDPGVTTFNFLQVGTLRAIVAGTTVDQAWAPVIDTWYHVAFVRYSGNIYHFVDGVQIGTAGAAAGDCDAVICKVGDGGGTEEVTGWIDEFRISVGVARWTSNFTPPTKEYIRGNLKDKINIRPRAFAPGIAR